MSTSEVGGKFLFVGRSRHAGRPNRWRNKEENERYGVFERFPPRVVHLSIEVEVHKRIVIPEPVCAHCRQPVRLPHFCPVKQSVTVPSVHSREVHKVVL